MAIRVVGAKELCSNETLQCSALRLAISYCPAAKEICSTKTLPCRAFYDCPAACLFLCTSAGFGTFSAPVGPWNSICTWITSGVEDMAVHRKWYWKTDRTGSRKVQIEKVPISPPYRSPDQFPLPKQPSRLQMVGQHSHLETLCPMHCLGEAARYSQPGSRSK